MTTNDWVSVIVVDDEFTFQNVCSEFFVLVGGIYIVGLVFILTRFNDGIDEGDADCNYCVYFYSDYRSDVVLLNCTYSRLIVK